MIRPARLCVNAGRVDMPVDFNRHGFAAIMKNYKFLMAFPLKAAAELFVICGLLDFCRKQPKKKGDQE